LKTWKSNCRERAQEIEAFNKSQGSTDYFESKIREHNVECEALKG